MGAISALLATATSSPAYRTSSITLAPFQPALTALVTSSTAIPTATSVIVATASAIALGAGSDPGDVENGECQLLGPFAVFIQGALGALALLSLVYKRWRERPQRPLKIWGFDVSKQVVGSILLHIANLLMSMLSSGQLAVKHLKGGSTKANPCSFYLLNLAIDVSAIILVRAEEHN